jgi:hypothetical protein
VTDVPRNSAARSIRRFWAEVVLTSRRSALFTDAMVASMRKTKCTAFCRSGQDKIRQIAVQFK